MAGSGHRYDENEIRRAAETNCHTHTHKTGKMKQLCAFYFSPFFRIFGLYGYFGTLDPVLYVCVSTEPKVFRTTY